MLSRGVPKPEEWRAFDRTSQYASDWAADRFLWLLQYDPYGGLLTEHTQYALRNLFFSPEVLSNEDYSLVDLPKQDTGLAVMEALDDSPVAELFGERFKLRLARMVQTAIFSGSEDNGPVLR